MLKNCLYLTVVLFLAAGGVLASDDRPFEDLIAKEPIFNARTGSNANAVPKTLLISCIDYRLRDEKEELMRQLHLVNHYDEITMPGASLSITGPAHSFEDVSLGERIQEMQSCIHSSEAVLNTIKLVKAHHHIKSVILLDHENCAAYHNFRGSIDRSNELEMHKAEFLKATSMIQGALQDNTFPVYPLFIGLNGLVQNFTAQK